MKEEELKKLIEIAKYSAKTHLDEIQWKILNKHHLSYCDQMLMYEEIRTLKMLEELERTYTNELSNANNTTI